MKWPSGLRTTWNLLQRMRPKQLPIWDAIRVTMPVSAWWNTVWTRENTWKVIIRERWICIMNSIQVNMICLKLEVPHTLTCSRMPINSIKKSLWLSVVVRLPMVTRNMEMRILSWCGLYLPMWQKGTLSQWEADGFRLSVWIRNTMMLSKVTTVVWKRLWLVIRTRMVLSSIKTIWGWDGMDILWINFRRKPWQLSRVPIFLWRDGPMYYWCMQRQKYAKQELYLLWLL